VTNRLVSWALFGFTTNHEIRLYRINANNGSLIPIGTRLLPLTAASGLDFSPDGKFLYFIRTNTHGNAAMRTELPALGAPQLVLKGANEVRRTLHGHMLLTKQQQVYTITDPDAAVLSDVVNSTAAIWACPGPTLFPHVALQPIVIHNEVPVAYRHLGRKHYELSDH